MTKQELMREAQTLADKSFKRVRQTRLFNVTKIVVTISTATSIGTCKISPIYNFYVYEMAEDIFEM